MRLERSSCMQYATACNLLQHPVCNGMQLYSLSFLSSWKSPHALHNTLLLIQVLVLLTKSIYIVSALEVLRATPRVLHNTLLLLNPSTYLPT